MRQVFNQWPAGSDLGAKYQLGDVFVGHLQEKGGGGFEAHSHCSFRQCNFSLKRPDIRVAMVTDYGLWIKGL